MAEMKPGACRLLVGSKPGGANDVAARAIARGIGEQGAIEMEVVNLPGKGQAIAWQRLRDAAPDGQVLSVASNVLLTSYLAGKSTLHFRDFTPVAQLIEEFLIFVVHPGRETIDWPGLVGDARPLTVGFIGRPGNARHLAIAVALIALEKYGDRVTFRPYETEEEALSGLSSGAIDLYSDTGSAIAPLTQAGTVQAIAVSARHRLPGIFKDIPCLAELGVREPFTAWRAIMGPPGMPRDRTVFWEGQFRALSGTQAWASLLEQHYWASQFLDAPSFRDFLEKSSAGLERSLDVLKLRRQPHPAP